MLHSARYHGRCARCSRYLAVGIAIYKLAEGWSCYECNLNDELTCYRTQVMPKHMTCCVRRTTIAN